MIIELLKSKINLGNEYKVISHPFYVVYTLETILKNVIHINNQKI